MNQGDIILMLITVLIVGAVIKQQLGKVTQNIDNEELNPDFSYYADFCNAIDQKLSWLKELVQNGEINDISDKDKLLENIANFSKELAFIQTMNTNRNKQIWEEKLFGFLSKVDDFVISNLKDAEAISQKIKEDLKAEFDKLSS